MSGQKRHEVTGKLSNRVMNMKFMKHAEQADKVKQTEETIKKLVDSSEWRIGDNVKLLTKLANKSKVVQNVGFSAIKSLNDEDSKIDTNDLSTSTLRTSVNAGRRIFGNKLGRATPGSDGSSNDKKRSFEEKDEDDVSTTDLEKLWEAETQTKKQKKSNGNGNTERNKKKSKRNRN
ncbi:Mpp6p [Kluyveromyces lactis]|uniref:KLLA0C08954p n=1 Tax=Kluyveromyces lactis (strain ATCC 8585 / CBS 2359 / DSM 70799 / NBRC 1267 / NRRL Y-1140 / WM37) TaxID=284590 RepID=Q6CTZ1_KLULA|nr:uncharacterized protein KLLA0_C08954g [Kluyveromyces lactis]CAH01449.1 KLLA0C08954p [Kluyveromyces lactis]|eukprot:XP_452598.1 uncharacterized protein KLLA0_C08954g [Kluyveromyces lactis]